MTRKKRTSLAAVMLAMTMLAPMSAMAAPASGTGSDLTYGATKAAVMEKAKILTAEYGVTSVQYALMDEGEIVISGQTGKNDLNDEVPLTANTIYGIGSTSKMMVTASVMMLVDEGKIELDKPVVTYISEFKMKDERYKQITPRMLLNHSSGLLGTSGHNATLYGDNDTQAHDTFLDRLATQNLKADPGAFSVYSNDSFTLAEILVEKVSGMTFTAFIHQHFTEPLGMEHTKTPQDNVDPAQMAAVYSPQVDGQLPLENYNIIASGGIYSTAEDLVRFSQIFTGEVEGILSPESVEAMAQEEYRRGMWPNEADSSIAYGLGWDSVSLFPFNDYGIQTVTKGGDTLSYHSSLVVLPEYNMAAAVTSSGGSSSTDQLIARELLLGALEEKQIIAERKPEKSFGTPVQANMPQEIMHFAGNYGARDRAIWKLNIKEDGQLTLSSVTAPNSQEQLYVYTSDGSFVNEAETEKLAFIKEENGKTYLWSRSYVSAKGLGQLATSEYKAVKLDTPEVPADVTAAWQDREGKQYVLMNEKYTSMVYMNALPIVSLQMFNEAPGRVYTNSIVDANLAVGDLQIPGMAGRDLMNFEVSEVGGVEYISAGGSIYASEDIVKLLYAGNQSKTTIQASGYATWYSVPESAAGKRMTVNLPSHGAFAVYDQAGRCINHSVVSGTNEVILPENGRVVFAGETDSQFEITLTSMAD